MKLIIPHSQDTAQQPVPQPGTVSPVSLPGTPGAPTPPTQNLMSARGRVLRKTSDTRFSPSKYVEPALPRSRRAPQRLDLTSSSSSDTESEEDAKKRGDTKKRGRQSTGAKAPRDTKKARTTDTEVEEPDSSAETSKAARAPSKSTGGITPSKSQSRGPKINQKQRTTSVPDTNDPMDAESDPGVCVCVCACACVCVCLCMCVCDTV